MCFLFEPTTFMNLSGEALLAFAQFYKIKPEEILIVHDDLDLPPGSARLKFDGGHGGHNGLRDIYARFNTKRFYRLRIGIGHPNDRHLVSDYVLHKPSKADETDILTALDESLTVLSDVIHGQFEKAMNKLHTNTK
jgi:peptidyl-tRNA hydrolase, PTH1 family